MSLVLNRSRQVPADETPAFGGIAERFRRAGDLERAVALCRDGLKKFPDHLSARVTLGWALLDLGRYDEAQVELEQVLKRAPDNLAAIRGLAELHERAENAVVVPLEDQEAAEIAQAIESVVGPVHQAEAVRAPVEKAPVVHEPAPKRGKAQHAASHPVEPPPAQAKAEPDALSVFAESVAAIEPEPPQAAAPIVASVAIESAPIPVEPAAVAHVDAVPSLEELSAEFGGAVEAFEVEPPPPSSPVFDDLPAMVEELLPSSAAEPVVATDDVVLDVALEADTPFLDLAGEATIPDVDALLSSAALLTTPEADPVALLPEPAVDMAATHAEMLAEQVSAPSEAHPQPDVSELLAQLAQEPDAEIEAPPAALFAAEPAALAHPEPDISELVADLAHGPADAASTIFGADAFPMAEAHPEPQVAERPFAESQSAAIETFEQAPMVSADGPDFLAAMEATMRVEPPMPDVLSESGDVFSLSGEPPAVPIFEEVADLVFESEPLPADVAPMFDFDAPVVPIAPVSAPIPVFAPLLAAEPAPAVKPASSRASKSKSKKTVAAFEKMLRQIGSRKLEVAAEYPSS